MKSEKKKHNKLRMSSLSRRKLTRKGKKERCATKWLINKLFLEI
jgi:hypothetical protein